MNKKQRRIIAWTVFVFVPATFFPPWIYTHDQNGTNGGHAHTPAGYHCILSPPTPETDHVVDGVSIDASRLVLEWLCILVTAGAAWLFLNVDTGTASAAQPTASLPSYGGKPVSRRMTAEEFLDSR